MGYKHRQDNKLKRAMQISAERFMIRQLTPFEEGMNNRIKKLEHVRAKPRVQVSTTGGFGVTRRNKKGD